MSPLATVSVLLVAGIFSIAGAVVMISPVMVWIRARRSGAHIGLMQISRMILRRVDPMALVRCKVILNEAGIDAPAKAIEKFCTVGGDPQQLAQALVTARNRGAVLTFEDAVESELSRREPPKWFGQR